MDFNATRHVIRRSDTTDELTIQSLCLHVRDTARKRYEFGCGTLTLTVDPLMESAAVVGRIPTVVRVLNQTRQIARSTIDIRVDLTGTGPVKPLSAPLTRCLLSDGASLSVWSSLGTWRAATGRLSLRSAFLGPYFSTPLHQGFVFDVRYQAVVASDTPLAPAMFCAPV